MIAELLRVKTRLPPLTRSYVERSAVRERAERGLVGPDGYQRRLTLVSAPAGYGKTTFVRAFHAGREARTAWLAIDADDGDAERFWRYCIAALQVVEPTLGATTLAMLGSGMLGQGADAEPAYLTPLLNELIGLEAPLYLVLDDYHLIDESRVHQAMHHFLTNLPPSVHVSVTTRSDPPWPLATWRAKGVMAEVRQGDLRFDVAEATALIERSSGSRLTGRQSEVLCERVEGWATGLQLAAVSLATAVDADAIIEGFSGGHRHVLHYLSDEVFAGLAVEVRDFLVATSVLERTCGSLCDALTGRHDGEEMLAYLERNNLFVVPLDDAGSWYRYHHLFADLLRLRLERTRPGSATELHRRAAEWFLAAGEPGEAVRHLRAGGRSDDVVRVLRTHALEILCSHGSLHLHRALTAVDLEALQEAPQLLPYRALLTIVYDGHEAARRALDACVALCDGRPNDEEMAGMVATAQAFACISDGELPEAFGHAQRALGLLGDANPYWRMTVGIYLGDAHLFANDPKGAYPAYLESQRSSHALGQALFIVTTALKVATSLHHLGRLDEAEAMVRDALRTAKSEGYARAPRVGLHWGLLGALLRERGDLDEADACIERSLRIGEPERAVYGWNCLHAAELAYSQGRFERVLEVTGWIERLDRAAPMPAFVTTPALAWAALAHVARGTPAAAETLLARRGVLSAGATPLGARGPSEIAPGWERAHLALARARLAAGDPVAAAACDEIERRAREQGHLPLLIETLLVRAAAAQLGEDRNAADGLVLRALEVGAAHGFFQTHLDGAPALVAAFVRVARSAAAGRGATAALAARVCAAVDPSARVTAATGGPEGAPARPAASTYEFVEPLSPREIDIVAQLASGRSNESIGEALGISAGTVKWHLGNVFGKLGVRNRTAAVAAARELGYL